MAVVAAGDPGGRAVRRDADQGQQKPACARRQLPRRRCHLEGTATRRSRVSKGPPWTPHVMQRLCSGMHTPWKTLTVHGKPRRCDCCAAAERCPADPSTQDSHGDSSPSVCRLHRRLTQLAAVHCGPPAANAQWPSASRHIALKASKRRAAMVASAASCGLLQLSCQLTACLEQLVKIGFH